MHVNGNFLKWALMPWNMSSHSQIIDHFSNSTFCEYAPQVTWPSTRSTRTRAPYTNSLLFFFAPIGLAKTAWHGMCWTVSCRYVVMYYFGWNACGAFLIDQAITRLRRKWHCTHVRYMSPTCRTSSRAFQLNLFICITFPHRKIKSNAFKQLEINLKWIFVFCRLFDKEKLAISDN